MRPGSVLSSPRRRLLIRGILGAVALPGSSPAQPAEPLHAQVSPHPPAPGESLPVVRHTLENGMTFLILARPRSPTAALVVHYPVGSIHEHLGNTGIAHVLEHMMFKGTEEIGTTDWTREALLLNAVDLARDSMIRELASGRPDSARIQEMRGVIRALEDQAQAYTVPNEFDRILSAEGARGLNATTSYEATRYFVELPANRVELWFALESDRMANPVFREFFTELDVVMEERRMRLETSPGGVLENALLATAFQVHPYGVPVIGHASDLDFLTRKQAMDYFRRHYGPRNAVAAIVGDVDVEQVKTWADAYFAPLLSGAPLPPVLAREPEQSGERRVTVDFDAEPRLMIGWRAVSGLHPDAPALSMLASVLTGGRTTRLYRRLVVEDRSAVHVSAHLSPGFSHPRLVVVGAVVRSPHTPEEIERAIYEEIENIKDGGLHPLALVRIRNQLRAGEFRRLASNLQLAGQIAESEAALGDWREIFRLSARIMDVTLEDVQRVARTYLTPRSRTVATLVKRAPS